MWRMMDANLNRLREGLRVLEDLARFTFQERALAEEARAFRHQVAWSREPEQAECLVHRDVAGDWGKDYRSLPYPSLKELVLANSRRVQEAARVLEELARLTLPEREELFRKVRFWAYAAEKKLYSLATGEERRQRCWRWRLYVIVGSEHTGGREVPAVVRAAIAGGAEVIQLREKKLSTRALYSLARQLREITGEAGVDLIINDRVDVALAVGADGVHLGSEDLPLPEARRVIGDKLILGATAHSLEEALEAQAAGADYLGVGPVFPTATKPELKPGGLKLLREVASQVSLPVVAIGGITAENVREVLAQPGVKCVAVIRAVATAPDVKEAAARLKQAMEGMGS
ncbi:thiamine-phosphate pyrophosphorylase [Ammonifex degensii KC4]|uniref:Thiamine-phosphate synthase n=2 Tax=Ammonifex degensii TaxID=42838 RepID=C9RAN9_AMMDK|nr:thiamine-phosphate pyrophosphorylase [Ammonifex degensii KC4]